MSSDPSAGLPDAGTRTTTTALRGNGHVDFGPGARAPAPAVNGATDPTAVLALWERDQLLEERERIAADLHDHVIQRLFAAAMNLERMLRALGPGPLAAQLEMTVDGLDETIFQLRRMIGRLQRTASVDHGGGAALAGRLLDVLTEVSPALGFNPTVHLTGLNVPLPADIDEDLLAVLREALTNVARHARADSAEVEVAATADRLTVTVTDDGTGIDAAPARRSGLRNMDRRAHDHHGAFSAEALHRSGTQVTWTVPLR